MILPFFTVGHSTRALESFADMLTEAQVVHVVDIRTVPRSRTNPQFNKDYLPGALEPFHISYEHLAALGGLRGKSKTVSADVNGFWSNDSFHNYADYALSDAFHDGLQHLIAQGRTMRCAIMCAEAVWWRCHRRIVSDHLLAHGEDVFHIMGLGHVSEARLTEGAIVQADGVVVYPVAERR